MMSDGEARAAKLLPLHTRKHAAQVHGPGPYTVVGVYHEGVLPRNKCRILGLQDLDPLLPRRGEAQVGGLQQSAQQSVPRIRGNGLDPSDNGSHSANKRSSWMIPR